MGIISEGLCTACNINLYVVVYGDKFIDIDTFAFYGRSGADINISTDAVTTTSKILAQTVSKIINTFTQYKVRVKKL
jgi:hypothetical protein